MNILTMTEKLLRVIVDGDNSEKPSDLKLQKLFEEAGKVLGGNLLKNLSFFVSHMDNSENRCKFGCDYRNKLAHWTDIHIDNVNNVLVGELLFVFESVFNSVLLKYEYPVRV
ncbi:MAG: hypothetical protein MJY54_01105 [archaeon]|nr:hypothetical protein [archaeon]